MLERVPGIGINGDGDVPARAGFERRTSRIPCSPPAQQKSPAGRTGSLEPSRTRSTNGSRHPYKTPRFVSVYVERFSDEVDFGQRSGGCPVDDWGRLHLVVLKYGRVFRPVQDVHQSPSVSGVKIYLDLVKGVLRAARSIQAAQETWITA